MACCSKWQNSWHTLDCPCYPCSLSIIRYSTPCCLRKCPSHQAVHSSNCRKHQKLVRSLLVRTCCGQPVRTKNNYFGDADRDLRTAEMNSRRQFSVILPRNSRHVMRITHNCGLRKLVTKQPADSLRIANINLFSWGADVFLTLTVLQANLARYAD